MTNHKKIEIGIKAFILHEGEYLMMHNNGVKEDVWELPGGRMEFGETMEETLHRELLEEAGLEVKRIKILDTWNHVEIDYHLTGIIYLCTTNSKEVILSDEHDKYQWVKADRDSLKYLYDAFKSRMIHWNWEEIERGVL